MRLDSFRMLSSQNFDSNDKSDRKRYCKSRKKFVKTDKLMKIVLMYRPNMITVAGTFLLLLRIILISKLA